MEERILGTIIGDLEGLSWGSIPPCLTQKKGQKGGGLESDRKGSTEGSIKGL